MVVDTSIMYIVGVPVDLGSTLPHMIDGLNGFSILNLIGPVEMSHHFGRT